MKHMSAVLVVLAVLATPTAQASANTNRLSVKNAHNAVVRWSLTTGATEVKVVSCHRRSVNRVRCVIREWGFNACDESDACIAEDVWSKLDVTRYHHRLIVRWLDYIWD